MIKGIIFDLDGTLISEREYILGCLENSGAYLERTFGTNDAYLKLKSLFEIKWENIFNRYFEQERIPYTEIDISNLIKVYRETDPVVKLYPDAIKTLKWLKNKGIELALLTNGYSSVQKKKIEKAELEQFFDLIIIPDEQGREYWKPSKWGYNQILHSFNVEPEETMAVGDMDQDFIIPKATGMKCVYIRRDDRMKDLSTDTTADRVIHSLTEIEMEV